MLKFQFSLIPQARSCQPKRRLIQLLLPERQYKIHRFALPPRAQLSATLRLSEPSHNLQQDLISSPIQHRSQLFDLPRRPNNPKTHRVPHPERAEPPMRSNRLIHERPGHPRRAQDQRLETGQVQRQEQEQGQHVQAHRGPFSLQRRLLRNHTPQADQRVLLGQPLLLYAAYRPSGSMVSSSRRRIRRQRC